LEDLRPVVFSVLTHQNHPNKELGLVNKQNKQVKHRRKHPHPKRGRAPKPKTPDQQAARQERKPGRDREYKFGWVKPTTNRHPHPKPTPAKSHQTESTPHTLSARDPPPLMERTNHPPALTTNHPPAGGPVSRKRKCGGKSLCENGRFKQENTKPNPTNQPPTHRTSKLAIRGRFTLQETKSEKSRGGKEGEF